MSENELITLFLIEQHKRAEKEIICDDLVEPIKNAMEEAEKEGKDIWEMN